MGASLLRFPRSVLNMGETTGFAGEAPRVGCVSDGELGFWDVQKTWENGGLMVV